MAEFNIYDITRRVGHIGLPYPALGVGQGLHPVDTVVKTVKGAFSVTNELGGEDVFPLKIEGWQLPDEPMISLQGGNHIVETELNRGNRTANVLEQINLNNYKIRIRGTLYGEGDNYPFDEVSKLRAILEKKGSLDVSCPKLDIFNISRMAIKDHHWPDREGTPNEQEFQIIAISDSPITLELSNPNE